MDGSSSEHFLRSSLNILAILSEAEVTVRVALCPWSVLVMDSRDFSTRRIASFTSSPLTMSDKRSRAKAVDRRKMARRIRGEVKVLSLYVLNSFDKFT